MTDGMEAVLGKGALMESPVREGGMDEGCEFGLIDWCGDVGGEGTRGEEGPKGGMWEGVVRRQSRDVRKSLGW